MKIKNHEILHEINRGALTTVYKARHLNLDRIVLLKVLNAQWLDQQDLLERFRREAQISGRLNHPGIVKVYDFEISSDIVYISMEYVDGQTASEYIKKNHPILIEEIVNIFKDLLQALDYAHKEGVIHRDIKPANILLDKSFNARLTDFGLASLINIPGVTEQGHSLGTPAYMAPEQIKGEKCDQQTDLYSLGITIYELISGKPVFQKENTAATIHSVLSDEIMDLQSIRKDIPDELGKIVKMLIQKEKNKRPGSAENVLKLLDKNHSEVVEQPIIKNTGDSSFQRMLLIISAFIISFLLIFYFVQDKEITLTEETQKPGISDSVIHKTTDLSHSQSDSISNMASKIVDSESHYSVPVSNDFVDEKTTKTDLTPSSNAQYGKLFIICNPWAVVKINGDSIDTTPLKKEIQLAEGRHILELANPNFESIQYEYKIKSGQSDTLSFQLEPAFGYLMVQVTPWARLFVNNDYLEDTPLEKPLPVRVGTNIITLTNPALGTITDTIYVEAGRTIEKHFTFAN
ncbi:MAG: serine/threonine protein kinase [Calditrichae bacterium]|nr:serine/threonine protein kinase [Calditrichia bacterium]